MPDIPGWLINGSTFVIPAILAITMHEAAHGWVAWKLGDDTAYRLGRVSFNPFRHIDPVGTIILPGLLLLSGSRFLFGYAKPVPVAFWRLRNPRFHMVLVAAAGPGINLLLAFLSAAAVHLLVYAPREWIPWLGWNLIRSLEINLLLAVFNMLPLPPLDGGRVAVGLLPDLLAKPLARLEKFGILILLLLVFILPLAGQYMGLRINIIGWIVDGPVDLLSQVILAITGIPDLEGE